MELNGFQSGRMISGIFQRLIYTDGFALFDRISSDNDYSFISYSTVDKVNSIKNLANKIIIVSDGGLDELYPNKRPSNIIIKLDKSFRGGIFPEYHIPAKKEIFEKSVSVKRFN